ncbi:oxaloacetate acetylhydrolase [Penicillium lagena]|uniref:oxaloacetate acetylhydrolase n=1 Tax=Penicillium lagena TaxID=94218 RepID=UPI0025410685|nr:oxaloacetate acetylhydrolase [Penicillium lagena]KAJ5612768.1 oxaloacetate acetylhydrolase [Penicillium lagena]
MTLTISSLSNISSKMNGIATETTTSVKVASAASKLRNLITNSKILVCPGVYDGISARTALELAGTTASCLGMADLGVAQLHDMRTNAEMIANLDPFGPPLIADMDTGYGGPLMVSRAVQSYIQAGVAGFHIEDQILTKRCGHLKGKKVVELEEYLTRIRAANLTRERLQSDIVLIARTDALQQHGYDECIRRLKAARDLGADCGLLEGLTSKAMAKQVVQDLAPWPLVLNMVENGVGPVITVAEAEEMGFRVMLFSFACSIPAYLGIRTALENLKTRGVVGTPDGFGPRNLFEACGLGTAMAIDMDAGGIGFVNGT